MPTSETTVAVHCDNLDPLPRPERVAMFSTPASAHPGTYTNHLDPYALPSAHAQDEALIRAVLHNVDRTPNARPSPAPGTTPTSAMSWLPEPPARPQAQTSVPVPVRRPPPPELPRMSLDGLSPELRAMAEQVAGPWLRRLGNG